MKIANIHMGTSAKIDSWIRTYDAYIKTISALNLRSPIRMYSDYFYAP